MGDAAITFRVSDDGVKLLAAYEPTDGNPSLNEAWVRDALKAQEMDRFFIDDDAIPALIAKCREAGERFVFELGARRDGKLMCMVSASKMEALITIVPPFGGDPVTADKVYAALKEKGVVFGIDDQAIAAAVEAGAAHHCVIAAGRPPVPGADVVFKSLIPEMSERQPHLDERDIADYHNMGDIISVKVGEPLLRRIPPTPGAPGQNLMGEASPAPDGKDEPFAANLSGAVISPDDPNLLVAAVAGMPVKVHNGVIVEPVIKVQNVDLSTGNLNFEGTISIAEDVRDGMEVKASGDILVGGMVEAARLDAKGNIDVKGGIVGHGEVRNHKGELNPGAARIHCDGVVSALFVENALIEAVDGIIIQELSMQSELVAGNQIIAGGDGGGKGHIVGGESKAAFLVQAKVIGSLAGVRTSVQVGVDPFAHARLAPLEKNLLSVEKELEEAEKSLSYLHGKGSDIPQQLIIKTELLRDEMTTMKEEKAELKKRLEIVEGARIKVGQNIYSGVVVMVGNKVMELDEDREAGMFRLEDEELVY